MYEKKKKVPKNWVSVNSVPSLYLFILLCQFGCAYGSHTIMVNGNIYWPFTKRLCKHLLHVHIDLKCSEASIVQEIKYTFPCNQLLHFQVANLNSKPSSNCLHLQLFYSLPGCLGVCLAHSMYFLPCLTSGLEQHVSVASC